MRFTSCESEVERPRTFSGQKSKSVGVACFTTYGDSVRKRSASALSVLEHSSSTSRGFSLLFFAFIWIRLITNDTDDLLQVISDQNHFVTSFKENNAGTVVRSDLRYRRFQLISIIRSQIRLRSLISSHVNVF
jgi:hypothetical protein